MKDKKRKTFIFRGLGFPIKLINAPMRKILGEWVLDVNFEKLELVVLESLLKKPSPLTGDEMKFIRKFLDMTTKEFGEILGVSHVAVVKWESGHMSANLSADVCIRLYILDHLEAKDKEFRSFYQEINPAVLSKTRHEKPKPLVIDEFEELKSA